MFIHKVSITKVSICNNIQVEMPGGKLNILV